MSSYPFLQMRQISRAWAAAAAFEAVLLLHGTLALRMTFQDHTIRPAVGAITSNGAVSPAIEDRYADPHTMNYFGSQIAVTSNHAFVIEDLDYNDYSAANRVPNPATSRAVVYQLSKTTLQPVGEPIVADLMANTVLGKSVSIERSAIDACITADEIEYVTIAQGEHVLIFEQ